MIPQQLKHKTPQNLTAKIFAVSVAIAEVVGHSHFLFLLDEAYYARTQDAFS